MVAGSTAWTANSQNLTIANICLMPFPFQQQGGHFDEMKTLIFSSRNGYGWRPIFKDLAEIVRPLVGDGIDLKGGKIQLSRLDGIAGSYANPIVNIDAHGRVTGVSEGVAAGLLPSETFDSVPDLMASQTNTGSALVMDAGDGRAAIFVKRRGSWMGPAYITGAHGDEGAQGKSGQPGSDGQGGRPGREGVDGLDGAPGADGKDGLPGSPGKDGKDGERGETGKDGAPGKDGERGIQGLPGLPGMTFLRQINVWETALVLLALGVIEKRFPCAGAIPGERYAGFIRSFRMNGAASLSVGRPAFFYIVSVDCIVPDTVDIVYGRNTVAVGGKYELMTDILKVNA